MTLVKNAEVMNTKSRPIFEAGVFFREKRHKQGNQLGIGNMHNAAVFSELAALAGHSCGKKVFDMVKRCVYVCTKSHVSYHF